MPFNGAGVYVPPGADFPAVTQTVISSTHYNNVINDIATGLSLCLTKDGQQTVTANIPFGGFRATNVGITAIAGSVGTPAINVSDTGTGLYRSAASELAVTVAGTQRGRFDSTGLIVTGTVNVSVGIVAPIIDSGIAGSLSLKTNNGTTGFRVDNGGAVNFLSTTPGAAGTFGVLSANVGQSDANAGISFFGKGTGSFDFYSRADVAIKQQFQILDTASSSRWITVTGSNGGNPTLGVTAGSLAITPDTTIAGGLNPNFTSAETTVTGAGTTVTVAHGLGTVPRNVFVVERCKTAEFGYSIGDEVIINDHALVSIYADTTNVGIVVLTTTPVQIVRRDTFAAGALTLANWKYVVRAWK